MLPQKGREWIGIIPSKNYNLAKNLNYRENMVILHKFAAYTKETTDGTVAKDPNTAR